MSPDCSLCFDDGGATYAIAAGIDCSTRIIAISFHAVLSAFIRSFRAGTSLFFLENTCIEPKFVQKGHESTPFHRIIEANNRTS